MWSPEERKGPAGALRERAAYMVGDAVVRRAYLVDYARSKALHRVQGLAVRA